MPKGFPTSSHSHHSKTKRSPMCSSANAILSLIFFFFIDIIYMSVKSSVGCTVLNCFIIYRPSPRINYSRRHGQSALGLQLHGDVDRSKPAMAPRESTHARATSPDTKCVDLEVQHNEWKLRAPYKVHDAAEGFQPVYEASCQCGRVVYQINRDKPLDAKYCHCTTCQILHGKLYHAHGPCCSVEAALIIQFS